MTTFPEKEKDDPRVRALLDSLEDILLNPPRRRGSGEIVDAEMERFFQREVVGGIKGALKDILGAPEEARDGTFSGGGASGGRDFEEMIDRMVADALVRGKRTTGILETVFNLLPGLSGR